MSRARHAALDWFSALDAEGLAAHERELLARYVAVLHDGGVPVDAVTADSVWQGYLEGLVFYASSFGSSLLTIDPVNERGLALFEALVRRTFAAVDDLDAGAALGFT